MGGRSSFSRVSTRKWGDVRRKDWENPKIAMMSYVDIPGPPVKEDEGLDFQVRQENFLVWKTELHCASVALTLYIYIF